MKLYKSHIILIIGLLGFVVSFFFFAIHQPISQLLFLSGFFVTIITLLVIVFKERNIQKKILLGILVLSIVTIILTMRPILIKASFITYLKINEKDLDNINKILINKTEKIILYRFRISDKQNQLSDSEKLKIKELQKSVGANIIAKDTGMIYYELWGMLDNRTGIYYIPNEQSLPAHVKSLRKIDGNWYY